METLNFQFPAAEPGRGRTLVGCVSSGDLEVLIEPGTAGNLHIQVVTSVNGSGAVGRNCCSACSRAVRGRP